MSATRRAHSVDFSVDNSAVHVDATTRCSAVHPLSLRTDRVIRLSSTPARVDNASVHGGRATLSPASTDAKTTDENLSSMTDNNSFDYQVDSGDIPKPGTPPAPAVMVEMEAR